MIEGLLERVPVPLDPDPKEATRPRAREVLSYWPSHPEVEVDTQWEEANVGLGELRKERDLSLEAVSVLSDVDIATVSRIERSLQRPRPETVVRLARGLGIAARRMQAILDEESSEPIGA